MILVTGISGGIGRRMARRLLRDRIDFIGIDCVENSELPEDKFKKMDVRDASLGELIQKSGVDSIIHLAFYTKIKEDRELSDDIDLNGSRNVADCAAQKGVKNIVFISSGRVYGDQTKDGGIRDREGNYLNPADDAYGQNKIKAENIFLDMGKEHGIKAAALRLGIVCWEGGGNGMGDMLKATSRNGRFFALGAHNPPMQLVHVSDVIDACVAAIGKEGIFDILSEGKMSLVEMFSEAAKLGGKRPRCIRLPEKPVLAAMWVLWKMGLSPIPPLYLKMFGYDITRDLSKTIDALGKPKFTMHQILKGIVEG